MREEAEFEVEGYIGSRSRLRSRGGAPRRFATENVLCMLLGTPYSHLPQCCKQTTASQAAIHPGVPLFRTTTLLARPRPLTGLTGRGGSIVCCVVS